MSLGFIVKLNRLIGLYLAALKLSIRPRLWLPFFLYASLQVVVLLVCRNYVNPAIYPTISPLVSLLGEAKAELFRHYPGLFLLLPYVFQWGKIAVGIVFEGLAAGATAVLFVRAFTFSRATEWRLSYAFSKWPQLLLTWTLITAVLFAINWYLPRLFEDVISGSSRRMALFDLSLGLLTVAVYCVFIYAVPAIVVYKENVFRALGTSLSLFARYPIFSFFLALIPYLLTLPTSFLANKSDIVVIKFSPEIVFYILLAGIIVDMVVNYLVTGAVVKFLVEEQE